MKEVLMAVGMFAFLVTAGVFFILWWKERAKNKLQKGKIEETTKEIEKAQKIAGEKDKEITRLKNQIKSDSEQSIEAQNRLKAEYDKNISAARSENESLTKEICERDKDLREAEAYAHRIGMMAMKTNEEYNNLLCEKERIKKELEELKAKE